MKGVALLRPLSSYLPEEDGLFGGTFSLLKGKAVLVRYSRILLSVSIIEAGFEAWWVY